MSDNFQEHIKEDEEFHNSNVHSSQYPSLTAPHANSDNANGQSRGAKSYDQRRPKRKKDL